MFSTIPQSNFAGGFSNDTPVAGPRTGILSGNIRGTSKYVYSEMTRDSGFAKYVIGGDGPGLVNSKTLKETAEAITALNYVQVS